MDFDFENLIYIFGALAYFASAIYGLFKDKNKKKNIEDTDIRNKFITSLHVKIKEIIINIKNNTDIDKKDINDTTLSLLDYNKKIFGTDTTLNEYKKTFLV